MDGVIQSVISQYEMTHEFSLFVSFSIVTVSCFVVIANVFTLEQCAATISDIWNVIESFVQKPVRNDENLWTSEYVFIIFS